jgi:ATP-binding cassette, subfamily B, bacterial
VILDTLLKKAIIQFLRLDLAIRLVWKSAPGWMTLSSILVFSQGLLPLAGLYLISKIVDTVTLGVNSSEPLLVFREVVFWLVLAALVGVLTSFSRSLGELATQAQSQYVTDHVSDLLHAQSIAVDLSYYEDPSYYDTLHRAQAEAPFRPSSIVNGLTSLVQNSISLIGVIGLFLFFSPLIGIVMVLAAIPGALIRLHYSRKRFRFEELQSARERRSNYYHWLLVNELFAKEVRLFKLGELFKNRYQNLRHELRQGRLAITRNRAMVDWIFQTMGVLAIFFTLGYTAYQAITGKISLGDLIAIYMGFQIGLNSLQAVLHSLAGLYEDQLFLSHFYQFLELKPDIMVPKNPQSLPTALRGGVSFESVNFAYPNSDRLALKDVHFKLMPGQVVALVGANGSGKTTLVKLLCRLYDPTDGTIFADNLNLRQVDPVEWRKKISVIFQDYAHYQLTARENIWIGNVETEPDLHPIVAAAKKSGADSFINTLPQGYETQLGTWFEKGKELSGGEWQKIALARAFLRDSEIIILDEPTSALDPLAEAELFQHFRQLINGKSAILISHRFSTVQMADYIYVLDQGTIVEKGTHQELLHLEGIYAKFFNAQALFYKDKSA